MDEVEWPGTQGRAEQDHPMALGTKTFMVAALMAIAAFFGSIGATNAETLHVAPLVEQHD